MKRKRTIQFHPFSFFIAWNKSFMHKFFSCLLIYYKVILKMFLCPKYSRFLRNFILMFPIFFTQSVALENSPQFIDPFYCTIRWFGVEVCTGPGLTQGLYPARPAGRQMGGDFSNGPARVGKWGMIFPTGRAGPAHEVWFFQPAGP